MIAKDQRKNICRVGKILLCAMLCVCLCVSFFAISGAAAGSTGDYKNMKLIVGGIPFGVKFNTEGVIVIGFCDVDEVQKTQNPAYIAGLRPKDIIVAVNGKRIADSSELIRAVEESGGNRVELVYKRGGVEKMVALNPIFSRSEGKYKTGIWVRDTGAGIGTVTYIMPETLEFGGLGHGICDGETGELIPMSRGVVTDVKISQIKKGISGEPGELKGHFDIEKKGSLIKNTDCGVFGVLTKIPDGLGAPIAIATRDEVRAGEGEVICTLDDGTRCSYKIEISSVNRDSESSKCFVIKVKDARLIEKTGGIVQGMSGSPIIQNGKLIGAVTHVMINDPTVGYGIFIENMLGAAKAPMARAS